MFTLNISLNNTLHFKYFGCTSVGDTRDNCNSPSSSNQKQARVMALNLHMFSRILSLPVEKEQDKFTSTEVFDKILILRYESYFLAVQYLFVFLCVCLWLYSIYLYFCVYVYDCEFKLT